MPTPIPRLYRLLRRLSGAGSGPLSPGGSSLRKGPRPAVKGSRPALLEGSRFRLAVAAILKNEAANLDEWLCHHLAVGVEHFFLYDNGSDDDLHAVLRPYVSHGVATLTWFPLRGGQRDANNHALRCFGGTCQWLAYLDLDEFLVPHGEQGVPDLLARLPDADQVLVARREFCFSGHRERPEGLVTEAYQQASEDVPRVAGSNVLAKPIVRPERVVRVGVHAAVTVSGATIDVTGRRVPEAKPLADPVYAPLQVSHYYTKSWAEFEAKRARTSTSTHAFPLPEVPFDMPSVPDETAARWVPRTRALMADMRALAPDPYRYGSRLRLPDFPRNDQFSIQAAAVVANELAGRSVPAKMRAFEPPRVPGLPRGALDRAESVPIGAALGRTTGAADVPYEPARGRFSGSVHVRQHLAWLAAETDWSLAASGPDGLVVEGGSLEGVEEAGDGLSLRPEAASIGISGPVRHDGLRCHALLFALRVPDPVGMRLEVRGTGSGASWREVASFELAEPGTWLGFLALDDDPWAAGGVRLSLDAQGRAKAAGSDALAHLSPIEIFDLALVSYG